ncbi:RND transporter [Nonlabens sp. YIK11]|uniref:TolC family protein n=1 Tax=Nonlabens sp. YIK11 TaxID=1453349 RepID=UPI0006DC3797|nr:TolC family protein [Nonlabens sp. YIK11]KQC33798.1 RND transporter [Nonlabens sp. YIK11]
MIRNIKLYAFLILAMVLVHSCAPTLEVREENRSMPDHYRNKLVDSLNTANMKWQDFFADEYLKHLIDTALVNNQELNIMLQRVSVAQNEVQARKGEFLPFVGVQAGAEVEKVGEFSRNGAVETQLPIRENEAFPDPLTDFNVGVQVSWELDIWKKLRNSKKAAVMEYLASVEGKNFMVTQLIAELADSYYELITLDNKLDLIEQNLALQTDALRIVKLQKEAARATQLGVRRFDAEVFKNQSEKYEIEQQITEIENKINFLIGRKPSPIARNSANFLEIKVDTINAGLPSQLLQNRPDIRQAEYDLMAAKLDVKVARANFFPSIGIKAGVGLQAFKPQYLTSTPESLAYNLVGDLVSPLINRNAIKSQYNTANAQQLQAVFEYEKNILNGYFEVANELSRIDNLKKSYDLKEQQVAALTESIDIINKLFTSARADYMEVLLTQRDALESKMELVETKKDQLLARVDLYQALGGGWK